MTYVCAIAFIKFTFLGLYWKLFSVATQIPIAITAIVVLVWLITLVSNGTIVPFDMLIQEGLPCRLRLCTYSGAMGLERNEPAMP